MYWYPRSIFWLIYSLRSLKCTFKRWKNSCNLLSYFLLLYVLILHRRPFKIWMCLIHELPKCNRDDWDAHWKINLVYFYERQIIKNSKRHDIAFFDVTSLRLPVIYFANATRCNISQSTFVTIKLEPNTFCMHSSFQKELTHVFCSAQNIIQFVQYQ